MVRAIQRNWLVHQFEFRKLKHYQYMKFYPCFVGIFLKKFHLLKDLFVKQS